MEVITSSQELDIMLDFFSTLQNNNMYIPSVTRIFVVRTILFLNRADYLFYLSIVSILIYSRSLFLLLNIIYLYGTITYFGHGYFQ